MRWGDAGGGDDTREGRNCAAIGAMAATRLEGTNRPASCAVVVVVAVATVRLRRVRCEEGRNMCDGATQVVAMMQERRVGVVH